MARNRISNLVFWRRKQIASAGSTIRETVDRQGCQEEGSLYVMKLWIHATTMREISDGWKARKDVFGWHKLWNRTARMFLTATVILTAYPSVHAYSNAEIDDLDFTISSGSFRSS